MAYECEHVKKIRTVVKPGSSPGPDEVAALLLDKNLTLNPKLDKEVRDNVFEFYRSIIGQDPNDISLKQLPTNSNCGEDCCKAIMSAKGFLTHCEAANPTLTKVALRALNHVIEIYWRG